VLSSSKLQFAYPDAPAIQFPDVEVPAGNNLLVLGPSGSGKSTLLSVWAGMLSPKQGSVQVGSTDVHRLGARARDRWRGRELGIVFQTARLIQSQTIAANVALQARLSGVALRQNEVSDGLERLGIAHVANRLPADCSVGERQRAGILRAIIHQPNLILADEPTSALDRQNAARVAELLIAEARARGAALVVVTHDDRIMPLFDRSIELKSISTAAA